jgi:hypothetical protein
MLIILMNVIGGGADAAMADPRMAARPETAFLGANEKEKPKNG